MLPPFHLYCTIDTTLTMQDSCLIVDWIVTAVLTAAGVIIWAVPRKRLHPTATFFLGFLFFNVVFQFLLLEYAVSALEATGHSDVITLLIPVMALFATLLLWGLFWIAEWIIVTLTILMIAQTTNIVVSIPLAVMMGLAVWLILVFSPVNSLRHQFVVSLFSSAIVVIGIGEIILETTIATDSLPIACQKHFNLFLTCDATCESFENYQDIGTRIGWVIAFVIIFLVRWLLLSACTNMCVERANLKPSCLCCDCINYNSDKWMDLNDRKQAVIGMREIELDVDEDDL